MQWSNTLNAGFSSASPEKLYSPVIDTPPYDPAHVNVEDEWQEPGSLLNFIRKLIELNKAHRAFGVGDFNWAVCENTAIAAYIRAYQDDEKADRILVVQNLSGSPQEARIDLPSQSSPALFDLLTQQVFPVSSGQKLEIHLEPYQFYWLNY
jgi:maltose alpha-D-glucosyltransferase/alpha-amylase